MCSRGTFIVLLLLVPLMSGCPRMDILRVSQDLPQDLPILLEQNEYHRASLLLDRYPSIDTDEQRSIIIAMAKDYEDTAVEDALKKESDEDFIAALNIIDTALFKIPDSTLLPAYREKIDDSRRLRLRFHERDALLAKSHYLAGQQRAYHEREYLREPGFLDKWMQSRNRQSALALIDRLFDCHRTGIKDFDLETASQCLDMINTLDPTRDTAVARAKLNEALKTQQTDRTQVARINYARERKIISKTNKQRATQIVHETEAALSDNKLLLANIMFKQMPASESGSPEVMDVTARLNLAVSNRVSELISQGDRHYRADRVNMAINAWSDALLFEPEDASISDRLARARKVLARLDELKKKQHN